MKRELQKGTSGFSLSELLIVLVILLVLATLAAGVYSRAMEDGRMVQCVQKLKTILNAEASYSIDHHNRLVPYSVVDASGNRQQWTALLAPYATSRPFDQLNNDWIVCPSLKVQDPRGQPMANLGPIFTLPDRHAGILHYSEPEAVVGSSQRSRFANSSKVPSFMDIEGGYSTGNPAYCRGCYPGGAISPNPSLRQSDRNNFPSRHKGGANVGFLDGHVKWVPLATLIGATQAGPSDFFCHFDQ